MELQELENMWAVYDHKLSENTRINKEVLKHLLLDKPKKRITNMMLKAIIELVAPIFLLIWFFSEVGIRNDWRYWVGMVLFLSISTFGYYLSIRYLKLIQKVDLSNSLTQTRKTLNEIELFKLQRIKFGLRFGPVGAIAVFMISEINVLSTNFILPLVLILIVFGLSHYLRYRYGVVENFSKFKRELDELEALEKE